jgi:transcriptional regulator with XRE-family HTH domain
MEKGLSQQNLADRAEIEISQVYRIEKGKTNTTLSTIGALASALDISIAEIFSNLETAKL